MGEPVRIVDLVQNFAALMHHRTDVEIRFTGLRPGEKLNEELFGDGEERIPTTHSRISMALPADARRRASGPACTTCTTRPRHNRPDEVFEHLLRPGPRVLPQHPARTCAGRRLDLPRRLLSEREPTT